MSGLLCQISLNSFGCLLVVHDIIGSNPNRHVDAKCWSQCNWLKTTFQDSFFTFQLVMQAASSRAYSLQFVFDEDTLTSCRLRGRYTVMSRWFAEPSGEWHRSPSVTSALGVVTLLAPLVTIACTDISNQSGVSWEVGSSLYKKLRNIAKTGKRRIRWPF